eukprot:4893414-Pyramimonas_sp.AAC.1
MATQRAPGPAREVAGREPGPRPLTHPGTWVKSEAACLAEKCSRPRPRQRLRICFAISLSNAAQSENGRRARGDA